MTISETTRRIAFAVLICYCLAVPSFSQNDSDEDAVRVPDQVMKNVVAHIIRWYFKPAKKRITLYFSAENIKMEWLPKIHNINYIVLEKPERYPYERKVYHFEELERSGRHFHLSFGLGDGGCYALDDPKVDTGDTWNFRLRQSQPVGLRLIQVKWKGICA